MRRSYRRVLEVNESIEELQELLTAQIKSYNLRRVYFLIIMKKKEFEDYGQISEIIGVTRQTLWNWINDYEKLGIEGFIERKKGSGRPPYLNDEQKSLLEEEFNKGNFTNHSQVQEYIEKHFGIKIKLQTVGRIVNRDFNYRHKTKNRNSNLQKTGK